jgi:exodeoxyribonuclease-3
LPGTGERAFWDFCQAFEQNRGIRIDHFLLSPELTLRMEECEIDKTLRAQGTSSDHTPILLQVR